MARRRKKKSSSLPVVTVLLAIVAGSAYAYFQVNKKVMDERTAITRAVEDVKRNRDITGEEEELLRIQLALVDYVAKNQTPPESLFELIPTYFDVVPTNPSTNEPYFYQKEGRRFILRPTKEPIAPVNGTAGEEGESVVSDPIISDEDFVNPNDMQLDLATYDPTNKRDPFTKFDFSGQNRARDGATPLEQYQLDQLRFTAVLESAGGSLAGLVEDASGKGYTVRIGTRMGVNNGVVVAIDKQKISVLETQTNIAGIETQKVVEMKLVGKAEAPSTRNNRRGRRGRR